MLKSTFRCCVYFLVWNFCNVVSASADEMDFQTLQPNRCDVIVAGGTTAALGAAIAAAREFRDLGLGMHACLIEPTDWAGGQMTAAGLSAIDFAHHFFESSTVTPINVGKLSRAVKNNATVFNGWFLSDPPFSGPENGGFGDNGNLGLCWVSVRCYLPIQLLPLIEKTLSDLRANLQVFYNTVLKQVNKNAEGFISSVEGVHRIPREWGENYDRLSAVHTRRLSAVINDWYKTRSGFFDIYDKQVIRFNRNSEIEIPMVVDTSDWGELLVLGEAEYSQGVELSESEDPSSANDSCGQAFVFPMAIELKNEDTPMPPNFEPRGLFNPERYHDHFHLDEIDPDTKKIQKKFSFDSVWSYRRAKAGPDAKSRIAAVGDISSQNWTTGNDYPYRYFLLSKKESAAQISNWKGGIDFIALDEAEQHAIGWYRYLRTADPLGSKITPSSGNGTLSGLSKMPYLRDTRRSIGIGGFTLKYLGPDGISNGHNFTNENIAIGAYSADIHPAVARGCVMPPFVVNRNPSPAPFYIPFRALTNSKIPNLLVAGKTMAQSFLANSATRLHPIEFSTGTAAGVTAAFLAHYQPNTFAAWSRGTGTGSTIEQIRIRISERVAGVSRHAPVEWSGLEK